MQGVAGLMDIWSHPDFSEPVMKVPDGSITIGYHMWKPEHRVFYLPTDAQENCFQKNIKIYVNTAPTCFSLITIIRQHIIQAC